MHERFHIEQNVAILAFNMKTPCGCSQLISNRHKIHLVASESVSL